MSSQDLMQQMRSSAQDAGSWLENGAAAFESNVRNLLSTIDGAGILTHFSQDDNSHIDAALVRFQSQALALLQLTGAPREERLPGRRSRAVRSAGKRRNRSGRTRSSEFSNTGGPLHCVGTRKPRPRYQ